MTARRVIEVSGEGAAAFLQGLVTTDTSKLAPGALQWSALLTPQGKYLADFFLCAHQGGILIDAPDWQAEDLMRRLTLYRMRAPVGLAFADGLTVSRGTGAPPPWALPDPRDPALGWRSYAGAEGRPADWDALRVAALIPEAGRELIPNETYPLEAGLDRLGAIDYRKGCYVGQEVTARMHHKTELKKGLRRIRIGGAVPEGTPILTADGREAGTVFTQSGGRALAHLRFDRIAEGLTAAGIAVEAETAP